MLRSKAFATVAATAIAVACSAQVTTGQLPQDQTPTPVVPRIQATPVPPPVQLTPPVRADMNTSRPLGVEEAVSIALQHQTSIQIAQANVDAARGRTRQAQSAELPSLGLSAGYSKTNVMSGNFNSSSGFSAGATVSQLIFDFNVTRDTVRQAQALQRAQGHILTQAQADAVLAAKQAFYTVSQDEKLVTVAESNLKDRDGQLALAKARFTGGVGAPQDVVLAQTNVDAAVLQLTQARSAALTARVALAQALGVDPLTPITIQDSTEPDQAAPLPDLVQQAMNRRPEVLTAKESLIAASLGTSIATKTSRPSLFLALGADGQGDNGFTTNTRNTLGVTLSWSLYDGGLTAGRVAEARANQVSARKQLEQTGQNVTTEVANAYVALKTAEQAIPITASQVANAQEGVRLAEGRYRASIATFLEIIDAEAALTQAQINQVNANTNLQLQRAALAHAIGADPLARR